MNGIHDMGGMDGMGPIQHETNEPVFHARWEGRVFALWRAAGAWGKWNIDAGRHGIELLPPADYLRMSYYEKWLVRNMALLVQHGLVTQQELESGQAAPGSRSGRGSSRGSSRPGAVRTSAAAGPSTATSPGSGGAARRAAPASRRSTVGTRGRRSAPGRAGAGRAGSAAWRGRACS